MLCAAWGTSDAHGAAPKQNGIVTAVPILVYHRFGETAVDSMTVRTQRFDAHLDTLEKLGAHIIPLSDWVAVFRRGERTHLPDRAVVLTADGGHRSQADVLLPRLQKRGWPVTLFIYPSAISNARYAMTWDQLRQASQQAGVSIQSHTYWHPPTWFATDAPWMPPHSSRLRACNFHRPREVLRQNWGRGRFAWPGLLD